MKLVIINNSSRPVNVRVRTPSLPVKGYGEAVEFDFTKVEELEVELRPYEPPEDGEWDEDEGGEDSG